MDHDCVGAPGGAWRLKTLIELHSKCQKPCLIGNIFPICVQKILLYFYYINYEDLEYNS